jgi:hypothetical protein
MNPRLLVSACSFPGDTNEEREEADSLPFGYAQGRNDKPEKPKQKQEQSQSKNKTRTAACLRRTFRRRPCGLTHNQTSLHAELLSLGVGFGLEVLEGVKEDLCQFMP